jgi:hypothetical protein
MKFAVDDGFRKVCHAEALSDRFPNGIFGRDDIFASQACFDSLRDFVFNGNVTKKIDELARYGVLNHAAAQKG